MTATITTEHGDFTGRTVDSIIRREYGRAAYLRPSYDPNDPAVGLIVADATKPGDGSGWSAHVLATVRRCDPPYDPVAAGLDRAGRDLAAARDDTGQALADVHAAALAALTAGIAETQVARLGRVDRMTVRKWAGKL